MGAEQILLAELQRSIARQEAAVDSVRERAARLLGASALLAGLFAVATVDVLGWHSRARSGALVMAGLLVLWVLFIELPRGFTFDRNLRNMVEAVWVSGDYAERDVALPLARGLQESIESNEPKLSRLWLYYQIGIAAVIVQFVLWLMAFVPFGTLGGS